jgi:hypothetical protein
VFLAEAGLKLCSLVFVHVFPYVGS